MSLKTIRAILHPLRWQNEVLHQKAKSIPVELRPEYKAGQYASGCTRIVSNAIEKEWKSCRKQKQIPLDKQISSVLKMHGILYLKIQKIEVPMRVKSVAKLDSFLLSSYNSAVVWLRGNKWVADIQVDVADKYVAGKPEAIIGIDLNKEHSTYSIWIDGKEAYRAFDKTGIYWNTLERLNHRIARLQSSFQGTRRELKEALKSLYDAKRRVLRSYYGALRNKIVSHIPETYNIVFVVEDLEYLPRNELTKKQRTWANQELANGINYEMISWNGYRIVKVDPRGTTHTCYKCSRKVVDGVGRKVVCSQCYPKGIDRDLNGARNIALRYMLGASREHTCTRTMMNESPKPSAKEMT